MSETDLVRAVLIALSESGCVVWRNNSGRLADRFGRWVTFGLEGSADVIGWCRGYAAAGGAWVHCAVFIAIECKAPHGRMREAQVLWGHQATQAGVVYVVARSVQDAIDVVEQHQRTHGQAP